MNQLKYRPDIRNNRPVFTATRSLIYTERESGKTYVLPDVGQLSGQNRREVRENRKKVKAFLKDPMAKGIFVEPHQTALSYATGMYANEGMFLSSGDREALELLRENAIKYGHREIANFLHKKLDI
jgi:hypothetical protein